VKPGGHLRVDHQLVNLARIPLLAIDHDIRSGRLEAPPRPPVPSTTTEEQNQYDYQQDSFHIITTSLGWTGKQIVPRHHLHLVGNRLLMPGLNISASISDPAGGLLSQLRKTTGGTYSLRNELK
jgi:hypothetical protein